MHTFPKGLTKDQVAGEFEEFSTGNDYSFFRDHGESNEADFNPLPFMPGGKIPLPNLSYPNKEN